MRKTLVVAMNLHKGRAPRADSACASAIVTCESNAYVPLLHSLKKNSAEFRWKHIITVQVQQHDILRCHTSGNLSFQGHSVTGVLALGGTPKLGMGNVHIQIPTEDICSVGIAQPEENL